MICGDAAAGESGAQEIDEGDFGAEDSLDCRGAVVESRVGFDDARLGDFDGADLADAAEVVAFEVHDHV